MYFLIAYAVILLGVGLYDFKKNKNFTDYAVAGRSQKKLFITMSLLASTIGGSATVGMSNKALIYGFPAIWFLAAGGIATILQSFLLSENVRKSEALTLPSLAENKAGKRTSVALSVVIAYTWFIVIAAQFVAVAGIVSPMLGISRTVAVYAGAAVIIIYSFLGGQKSVIKTDLFQFGLLAIAVIYAVIYLFTDTPVAIADLNISVINDKFTITDLIYYLTVGGLSYFICPMMFSRLLSADSAKTARKSSLISGVGMIFFSIIIVLIGLWAKNSIGDMKGLDPLNYIIQHKLPGVAGIFLAIGLLSAIVSTADTCLIMTATVIEKNILRKENVNHTRIILIVVGIISAVIAEAANFMNIINLLMKGFAVYTPAVVPVLFIALRSRSDKYMNKNWALAAVIAGGILGMLSNIQKETMLSVAGIGVSLALSIAALTLGSSQKTEKLAA